MADELSREDINFAKRLGREMAVSNAQAVSAATASSSSTVYRETAIVETVYLSEGTLDVNMGTSDLPLVCYAVPFTTACSGVQVGDTVIIETYGHRMVAVGIVATSSDPAYRPATQESVDKAITGSVTEYAQSQDHETAPVDGWSTEAPSYESGKYIWMRTVTTNGSGDTETTDPVVITGNPGPKGEGVPGTSAYVHLAYANSSDGKTDFSVDDPTGRSYLGQYTDSNEDDSTDPTKYAWSLIKGATGAKGDKGDKGDAGKGISSATVQYVSSTSGTTAPTSGWQASIPQVANGSYLWTKTTTTYTSGSPTTSYSVAYIAKNGTDGAAGTSVTVKSATTTYQAGTSATSIPTGTWQDISKVTVPQGGYLWSKTVVTYSDGTSTTAYGVSYSAKDGADGASVSAVKIQYYKSTSSTTQTGGEWQDSVPDWTSGKYIWQRTQTTIGGKTVTGDPVLYGAFNSLATSVEGNTSSIQQLPSKLEAKFVTLDADRLSGDDWIKDPYFLNGATNTDKWSGSVTLAVGSKTQTARDSYWQSGAALRKVSKGQKLRLALACNDTGCTTGTNVGLGFRVANASKVWQMWKVPLQLGTTHSATHTGSYIYTVPDSYDGYYLAPFTQLEAATVSSATGTCVFSYIQITDITAAATDYSTLIRATSDGIEVGKADTSGTLSGVHTLMGTSAFSIHAKDHTELATFGADTVELGKNSSSAVIKLCKDTARIGYGTGTWKDTIGISGAAPLMLMSQATQGSNDTFATTFNTAYKNSTDSSYRYANAENTVNVNGTSAGVRSSIEVSSGSTSYSSEIWAGGASVAADGTDNAVRIQMNGGYVLLKNTNGQYPAVTAQLSNFADAIRPTTWKFSREAIGGGSNVTGVAGWTDLNGIFTNNQMNYTSAEWFTVSTANSFTVVKPGVYRIKLQVFGEGATERVGAGIYVGTTEASSTFYYCNGATIAAIAEHVCNLTAGTSVYLKGWGNNAGWKWRCGGQYTYVAIDYLGAI